MTAGPAPPTPVPAAAWQFRLWHLFALTAVVAVAAGLARAVGPGVLPLALGVAMLGGHAAGLFRPLAQGRIQTAIFLAAWVLFLASLALPAIVIFQDPVRGGALAWFVLVGALPHAARDMQWFALSYMAALDLANGLAAALPLVAGRLRQGRGQILVWLVCIAAPSTWVIMDRGQHLYVGYYLWCASFLAVLAALPLSRGHIAVSLALAAYFNTVENWG